MRVSALTGLALRELWISYRLLLLLAAAIAGGIVSALRPDLGSDPATLALGIAGCGVVVSAVAAASLAAERRQGAVAWLVLRAVPRSSVLLAWFTAITAPVVLGLAAGAVLAWLALVGGPSQPLDPTAFAALGAAAAVTVLQALAIGLLIGALARPLLAAVLATSVSAAGLGAGFLLRVDASLLPTAGLGLLAQATSLDRPLSVGLGSLGLGLATTGLLMAAAAAALTRVDL